MLKGKNVVKSSKKVQVNNGISVTGNTGRYVEIDVTTHSQYNNDVSNGKAKYLFDTENNINIIHSSDGNVDLSRFVTIGNEPMICDCIKIQDIFNFYKNGCIQQFYECFCESHSVEESITLARFLSAIGIEVWRNVTCYGGIYKGEYMVSNLGRVLRLKKNHFGKIVKPCACANGYMYVTLCHKGKKQNVLVHRLVGLSFIEEPTEPLECCHSNTNSYDNRLFNLEFKTHTENVNNPITQRKLKETLKAKFDKDTTESTPTATV